MSAELPYVSIVIPVFNEERYIANCLDSLSQINYPNHQYEIILVDNGSTDGTLAIAERYPVKIFIKEDVMVGAVRNYGVKQSSGDILAFLDSDCVVDPFWLRKGVEKISNDSSSVMGGQYLLRDDPSWIEKYWVLNNSKDIAYQTNLVGGCIFINKLSFEVVGGFDESLNSGEDSDLTKRLRQRGFSVRIDPSLSVVHLGYPNTVKAFVNRQIWHSADYVSRFPASLRDKVFILTCVFILSLILILFGTFWSIGLTVSGIFLLIFCPLVLSVKRILRSQANFSIKEVFHIYCLDFLYLVGRVLGVLSGVKSKLLKNRRGKVDRR